MAILFIYNLFKGEGGSISMYFVLVTNEFLVNLIL